MSTSLENRKVILIAADSADHRRQLSDAIERHLSQVVIYTASDGGDAWMKMINVPPHLIITDSALTKIDSCQLVTNMLADRRFDDTAALLVSVPPEHETFVDEIVMGRVQFLDPKSDEARFTRAVNRGLNFVAARESSEFRMRFLSPGEQLLREGDRAEFVYLVKKGHLKATHRAGEQDVMLGKIDSGEFVGEMAYINGEPRSADVFAVTDCEMIEIPVGHLDHLLFQRPSWSKALMTTLTKRVKKANRQRVKAKQG